MRRFSERPRAAGDEAGAAICEQVCEEEIGHVRFALKWFRRWSAEDGFGAWARALPPPLSPLLMRGQPLNKAARRDAGLSDAFIAELEAWVPV
jgi:uncharacterized ferritin-like protein (DUF455 family)